MKKLMFSAFYENPSEKNWWEGLPNEFSMTEHQFLREVQRFSEQWFIDMEVYRIATMEDRFRRDVIEVHFYLRWNRFAGAFKYHLDRLLRQCDELQIPSRKHHPCKSELILIRKDN